MHVLIVCEGPNEVISLSQTDAKRVCKTSAHQEATIEHGKSCDYDDLMHDHEFNREKVVMCVLETKHHSYTNILILLFKRDNFPLDI